MTDSTTKKDDDPIPLPLFFAKPCKDQVRMSPNGKWLAYRSRDKKGVLNLWLQEIATGQERQLTFEKDRDVCILYWFTYDDETIVYLREPQQGLELYHLYAIDLTTKTTTSATPRDLIQDSGTTCAMGFAGGLQVWLDPQQPRYVYTSTAPCGFRSSFWNISRLDIDSGEQTIVAENPLGTSWFGLIWFVLQCLVAALLRLLGLATVEDQPRATVQWFPDAEMKFRGRLEISLVDLSCGWKVTTPDDDSNNNWKQLYYVTWANGNLSLVGSTGGSGTAHFNFSPCNKWVDLHVCNKADTTSWERFDMAQGIHVKQLAVHAQSDITGFLLHPKTRAVQAVKFNYEKPSLECLSDDCPEHVTRDIAVLKKEFPSASVSIVSRTLDDSTWVVHVQSDVGLPQCLGSPSGYFVMYRHASDDDDDKEPSLEFLLSPHPELNSKYSLGTMRAVHIPSRDGQDLLCYLSRPADTTSTTKTPLVLLIHGGPQARDIWLFHPLCQLLCNRGMTVLQVNYRGSTGMGTRFMKLGMDGAFATGVQDDIQDAARYAVEQGWCLPDRLAIMGGSFGGYCALAAITYRTTIDNNSDDKSVSYQCAVSICPPSINGAANPHKAFYGNPLIARYWRQVFGNEISDNVEAAKRVSPYFHMDKVKCPLLLLHGQDDPRVPIQQTNDLFQKLQEQTSSTGSSECEYVRFAKEGHGIQKEQNVLYMYHCVERFLCHHLKLSDPPTLEDSWVQGHTGTKVSLGSDAKDKKV
ncbi:peptidase family member 6 [Seminavis robusta]|uniref:Peptidase family member 6 n=1 Tax=Seminavis robusta TaxID=568900 RepID=A0A9N8DQN9_9STRA|nr:peptidase family member 6 [Seminavis robusta]|eukprot:Sro217_g089890.1 peptidase family member 6 (750) ;mRNA; f:77454-79785